MDIYTYIARHVLLHLEINLYIYIYIYIYTNSYLHCPWQPRRSISRVSATADFRINQETLEGNMVYMKSYRARARLKAKIIPSNDF